MNEAELKDIIRTCPECRQRNRVQYASIGAHIRCGKCKTDLGAVSEPVAVSDSGAFDEILSTAPLPILVDFWAEWCGPCKMMSPELDKFAQTKAGHILVLKVNTEETPDLAQRFQINAIPTLAIFFQGQEVAQAQGARSAAQIESFMREHLKPR